jgi:Secretion system C-terminal sorting domain
MKQLLKKWYWSKQTILTLIIVGFTQCTQAQVNKVKNPSFEDTIKLTSPCWGQETLKDWHNLDSLKINTGLFALFRLNNSIDPPFSLPINGYGFTHPRNGDNVIAFNNYWIYPWLPPPSTLRSVPSVRLYSKLVSQKKYCAKAWLSTFDKEEWFTNGFGMYFDNGQLDTIVAKDSSGIYTFVTPQVQAQQIINDTAAWTLVSGTFIANGTETHLHLGNWLSDSATLKQINMPGVCNCSDLYIDDVSLIPTDIANWLHDTSVTLTDSVYIGLPKYEVPDAVWYTYNMVPIDTASGIWVKPTQAVTKYIQGIDVCDEVRFDTVVVYAHPLAINNEQLIMNSLVVWPNPATDVIAISHAAGQQVYLYNAVGTLVATKNIAQNKAVLQVGHLPKGLYVVKTAGQVCKVVLR